MFTSKEILLFINKYYRYFQNIATYIYVRILGSLSTKSPAIYRDHIWFNIHNSISFHYWKLRVYFGSAIVKQLSTINPPSFGGHLTIFKFHFIINSLPYWTMNIKKSISHLVFASVRKPQAPGFHFSGIIIFGVISD